MVRNHRDIPFERFADDALCHCVNEAQARTLKEVLEKRFAECGLQLHPEKTKIGIADLASLFPGTQIPSPFGNNLCLVLIIGGCIVVIMVQYAMRKTTFAWMLLIAVLLLITTVACTAPGL
jgi:Reverse transcriptase (RNA-dependent DNA polymerase)